jgi:hypothetical protein
MTQNIIVVALVVAAGYIVVLIMDSQMVGVEVKEN